MLVSAFRKFRSLSLLVSKAQRTTLPRQTAFFSSKKIMESDYAYFSQSIGGNKFG